MTTLLNAWRTFWFRPEPVYTLGLIRIAFGALIMTWTVSILPDLSDLFGTNGVLPDGAHDPAMWSLFQQWHDDRALLIGWAALLLSALAMTVGWHTRMASIAVCALVLSLQHRDPSVFNSGDVLVRIEALFLALAPSGAALSLDQRRLTGAFWSAQTRAPWAIRLMQLQLSIIYLASVRWKVSGSAWQEGTAVSYALRLRDMLIVPVPQWFIDNSLIINLASWGALAVELSLGVLVWNRHLRPWVLLAGVLMHKSIMLTMAVGFFTLAMFVLYLAFVPADRVRDLPRSLRSRFSSTRRVSPPPESTDTPTSTSAGTSRPPATPAMLPLPSTLGRS
jgi:HTTM domain